MKFLLPLCGVTLIGAAAFSACDDNYNIGETIVSDELSIVIDSLSTINSYSTMSNAVIQSRTLTQLIGIIDSDDFGAMSSDVVAQFLPANELDTVGVAVSDIDSLRLIMYMNLGSYVGDSITPMGLDVYALNKTLPSPIYSNFNPTDYYNPEDKLGSLIYNVAGLGDSESITNLEYRTIEMNLPHTLAQDLYKSYLDNPTSFSSPSSFAKIFPGIYIKNSFGSGRMVHVAQTIMRLYFKKHAQVTVDDELRDTIYNGTANYFAVTPEVVTNNNISLSMAPKIRSMIDAGDNIILAPTGVDVSFEFPAQELVDKYRANRGPLSVVNGMYMIVPAATIENTLGIEPPQNVLMVLSKKKDEFFADNLLTDNVTSFLASYDSTNQQYIITDMRGYFVDLLEKEAITPDDYTFTLTPVTVNYEVSSSSSYYYYYGTQSTTVSSIVPYVEQPAMAKIDFSEAKIQLTYSKQSASF